MLIKRCSRNYFLQKALFISTRFQSTDPKHYDIVVAGGGMIGTTLACTLGKNPKLADKKILLLESSKNSKWELPETYSNRVSSLNPATVNLLDSIGAWKHISEARYSPVKRLQVWDAMSDAAISFDHDNMEQPVAYVVENNLLLAAVQKEIANTANVEVLYQSKIQNCRQQEESEELATVCLENGTKYTCELLLGCDGFNSLVRTTVGFHYISLNYNGMGIVTTLKIPEDFENTVAWQRHLPNSAFLALLPLRQGLSSMVWSTNSEEAKRLVKLPEDQFVDAINDALWRCYKTSNLVDQTMQGFDNLIRFFNLSSGSMTQCPPKIVGCDINSRALFPLGLGHATNYVTKGVALVGDAAHRIHPLAGQGVNLGFGDIISLNRVLGEAAYAGSPLGSLQYLKDYETERQRHNVPIMLAVHGIHQLNSTQCTPLVLLRSLGLQATHALSPLKKLLMAQVGGVRYEQI